MTQHAVFNARLERLAAHAGNTNATLHIGMDEQLPRAAIERHRLPKPAVVHEARTEPFVLLLALVSGSIAWIWAQWLRVNTLTGTEPAMGLLTDLGIGLIAVLLLRAILGLHGLPALLFQLAGMAVALFGLHNLVHLWPDAFARLFPAPWVGGMLSTTAPMSVNLAAISL